MQCSLPPVQTTPGLGSHEEVRYASLKQNGNGPMNFRVLPVNNYVQVQTTSGHIISYHTKYHFISYHIISYVEPPISYIKSQIKSYHIINQIISYHILSIRSPFMQSTRRIERSPAAAATALWPVSALWHGGTLATPGKRRQIGRSPRVDESKTLGVVPYLSI